MGTRAHTVSTWFAFPGRHIGRWFTSALILCLSLPLNPIWPVAPDNGNEPVRLEFRLEADDVLTVSKHQDIQIIQGPQVESREELNRIVLKVEETGANYAQLAGFFHTYARTPAHVGEYKRDRDFESRFLIYRDGHYEVPDDFIMPNLRSLPTFPDQAVRPGDQWSADALETMDFGSLKVKLPARVDYTYTGLRPLSMPDGSRRNFDRIEYTYTFNHRIQQGGILAIAGYSACEMWFDRDAGVPVFDANRLVYRFFLADGNVREFHFRIDSWYIKSHRTTAEEKEEIVRELEDEIGDNENLRVRPTEEGVVVDLNAILFEHNSAELSPAAKAQVAIISRLIQKYPEREIRISGHTDSTGSDQYNRQLSEQRARSVVRELQREHGVDNRRMSFHGYGETRPVAPNTTPEGRARNRRVEVLIVTE